MLYILLLLSSIFFLPFLILRPVLLGVEDAEQLQTHQRLQITDLFSLLFLISLFLAPFSRGVDSRTDSYAPIIVVFLAISVLIWFAGLKAVNDMRIRCWRRRVVAVGLLFPIAILSGFVNCALFLPVIDGGHDSFPQIVNVKFQVGMVIWSMVLFVLWGLSFWVAKEKSPNMPKSASKSFG